MINPRQAIFSTILIPLFGIACLSFIFTFDINQSLFLQLNSISQFTGENLWAAVTLIGDPVVILSIALALHSIAPQISFAILPTLLIGGSSVFYFKWLFAVVRPPGALEDIIIIGQPPISGAFPSGHATGAFALATLLILFAPNRYLKLGIFGLALLAGLSRIAVGAHWPLDVSGGIVFGWLSAILGAVISRHWQQTTKKTHIINILLLVTAAYLVFRNTGYPQIYGIQLAIAISCATLAAISLIKSNNKTLNN